ncbi:MAG: NRAMP family divalent metal transporter [Spirochaetota bacterium]
MVDKSLQREEELKMLEEAMSSKGFDKFKKYVALMGPAWLAIALNIGGATVTASVVLASKVGYKFLWAIIPEVFIIWIVCVLFVRFSIITGEGPVSAARRYMGEAAAWITGISVFIVNLVFHAVQYYLVGLTVGTIFGIDQRIAALVGLAFVLLIVLNPGKGRNYIRIIEKTLRVLIWALLISFVVVLFMVEIDWGAFFKGLFLISGPANSDETITLIGLLGAAIAINVPVMAAYGASQRSWGPKHRGMSIFELTYTNIILMLVQFVVIMAVTSTLFVEGVVATSSIQAAKALAPFAGEASTILFSLGLLAAVFTTMVSQVFISGYIVTDTLKWEVEPKSTKFKLSMLLVTIFGVTAPLFGWNAFNAVVYGSAFNMTFAPLLVIFWMYMSNKKDILGQYKIKPLFNVGIVIATILILVSTFHFWFSL